MQPYCRTEIGLSTSGSLENMQFSLKWVGTSSNNEYLHAAIWQDIPYLLKTETLRSSQDIENIDFKFQQQKYSQVTQKRKLDQKHSAFDSILSFCLAFYSPDLYASNLQNQVFFGSAKSAFFSEPKSFWTK